MTDLIKYQKIVYAAQVASVEKPVLGPEGLSAVFLTIGGFAIVSLPEGSNVQPGDYLIRNANDGSATFMAKAEFESEYVRAE